MSAPELTRHRHKILSSIFFLFFCMLIAFNSCSIGPFVCELHWSLLCVFSSLRRFYWQCYALENTIHQMCTCTYNTTAKMQCDQCACPMCTDIVNALHSGHCSMFRLFRKSHENTTTTTKRRTENIPCCGDNANQECGFGRWLGLPIRNYIICRIVCVCFFFNDFTTYHPLSRTNPLSLAALHIVYLNWKWKDDWARSRSLSLSLIFAYICNNFLCP